MGGKENIWVHLILRTRSLRRVIMLSNVASFLILPVSQNWPICLHSLDFPHWWMSCLGIDNNRKTCQQSIHGIHSWCLTGGAAGICYLWAAEAWRGCKEDWVWPQPVCRPCGCVRDPERSGKSTEHRYSTWKLSGNQWNVLKREHTL